MILPVASFQVETDMGMMARGHIQENLGPGQAPLRFGVTALLIGNLCLAFGPFFVRTADTGATASAFWRIALATPLLFAIAALAGDRARRLPGNIVWLFALSGLFFAADLAAWHYGIFATKLANANLLGNSTVFLLPLWAFVAARAWPTRPQGAALALAGLGTALLLGRSLQLSAGNLVGDLLCLLAGALYTGYLIIMARAREGMGAWPVLAWASLMSALPLLIFALAIGERLIPSDWTPLFAYALLSQIIGQGLMIYAIGGVPPLVFGLMLLLQPIIAATIGWLVYGERLGPLDWAGAALIGLALVLVQRSK